MDPLQYSGHQLHILVVRYLHEDAYLLIGSNPKHLYLPCHKLKKAHLQMQSVNPLKHFPSIYTFQRYGHWLDVILPQQIDYKKPVLFVLRLH